MKIEDFTGAGEIPLFGKDWLDYHNSFMIGTPLFIRGKAVPKQWGQGGYDLALKSVELLSDVKDSVIDRITLSVPLDRLTVELVEDLAEIAKESPGRAELYFNVYSGDNMKACLFSRKIKISVQKKLVNYVLERPEIVFKIN